MESERLVVISMCGRQMSLLLLILILMEILLTRLGTLCPERMCANLVVVLLFVLVLRHRL